MASKRAGDRRVACRHRERWLARAALAALGVLACLSRTCAAVEIIAERFPGPLLASVDPASVPLPGASAKYRSEWRPRSTAEGVWAVIVTTADYVTPAMVLGYSILRTNTSHETAALVSRAVPLVDRLRLAAVFDRIHVVEPIRHARPEDRYVDTWTKLHAFNMTQYPKVVVLEADNLFLQNADEAFRCLAPCAVPDGALWHTSVYGPTMNSGLFLLRPARADFEALLAKAADWDRDRDERGVLPMSWNYYWRWDEDYGDEVTLGPYDQALLNEHFKRRITGLPYAFGFLPHVLLPDFPVNRQFLARRSGSVRIVHYAEHKPWAPDGERRAELEGWFAYWHALRAEMPPV